MGPVGETQNEKLIVSSSNLCSTISETICGNPSYKALEELFRKEVRENMQYGEVKTDTSLYRKKSNTARSVWTKKTAASLLEIVSEDPNLHLDEIRERLAYTGSVWWKTEKITRVLHDLGCYRAVLTTKIMDSNQVVYLGETCKDRGAARSQRCWSGNDAMPIIQETFDGYPDKKYALLAACDENGFITRACHVAHKEDGAVDIEYHLGWLKDMLCPLLRRYDRFQKRSVVVLDNASIHHAGRVVDAIEANGALVINTAEYSPDLNPIECMFAKYAQDIQRNDKIDWVNAHVFALSSVTPSNAQDFFRRCNVPEAKKVVDEVV